MQFCHPAYCTNVLCIFFVINFVCSAVGYVPSKHRANADFFKQHDMPAMEGSSGVNDLTDAIHGVKMGISSDMCDNAADNLEVDWDGSALNYTCFHPKDPLPIIEWLKPVEECYVPKGYIPKHVCMSDKIDYEEAVPTYGSHRPLWPIYGEYIYVPPQRWLHNLEHGAIVMLYHPCAEPLEVERLRRLLKSCLRRYVITPYSKLPVNRPLALLSWGCKLIMNTVDKDAVTHFIKKHALHAPEGQLAKQGQYSYKLLRKSHIVLGSNYQDSSLCPEVDTF